MALRLTKRSGEALLAAVIIARSTSLLLLKLGMNDMDAFTLTALRFTTAGLLLLLIFRRRVLAAGWDALRCGAAIGLVFFCTVASETTALRFTATSVTSFLENTAVVLVPLILAAAHRRLPEGRAMLSALLCLAGVALLTLGGGFGRFGAGEAICVLTAFLYALSIITTDRMSHSGTDPLAIGIVQVCTIAALAWIASFAFETPALPRSGQDWAVILALAVVCTGFGFTLQPVAQSATTAERAAMFCALSPLSAATLGVVFLHEPVTAGSLAGAALILSGIILPNALAAKKGRAPDVK